MLKHTESLSCVDINSHHKHGVNVGLSRAAVVCMHSIFFFFHCFVMIAFRHKNGRLQTFITFHHVNIFQ